MFNTDIGIDLGTASILVYIKGKGVVLKEPSVVAIDRDTEKIKAVGEEARLMIGRTPDNIVAVRPLKQGVISDYSVTEQMIRYFIQKSVGKRSYRKTRICVCIPCGNMIVDIGGGTTDIAVISLGGTVVSTSVKVAGDDFDEAIVRYMRKKHNLLIGDRTAEEIKIGIGTCYNKSENKKMEVRGRNLVTGLPKTIEVTSEETEEALSDVTTSIVDAVHRVLEQTPPELAADIAVRGIVLTGGGCLLHGLDQLIEAKTGINTMTAEDPMTAVAIGTGQYLEYIDEEDAEKIK